jgi:predicted nucleotidyltransferase component of viral defense system
LIPRAYITAWRTSAPWPTDAQIEQDLVLSRALVEMFSQPGVAERVAFRGGSALHKLFLNQPGRYSEDIDLVQIAEGPIGPAIDAIRSALDSWLGAPRRNQGQGRVTMLYRFETTSRPVTKMRLKVEINTREHFTVLGLHRPPFVVKNPWFSGEVRIGTYRLEELLGTKLRALYQRKKGRDLYDLWLALTSLEIDDRKVVKCFERYLEHEGNSISRAEFEKNMIAKLKDAAFVDDIAPLLPVGVNYDATTAGAVIQERLIARLRGEPWKGRGNEKAKRG